jgi:hypothetical protein
MSPLEQRYRRLLRWLPEPARSRWADDMTETYLSVATADDPEYAEFGSPTAADRLDVARLALRLRLGAPGSSVRAVAAGQTVRLVALAGTVVLAPQALIGVLTTAWMHGTLPGVAAPQLDGPLSWGPREATTVVVGVLVVALAVCLVRGRAAARPLALAALVGVAVEMLTLPSWTSVLDRLPAVTWAVPLVAAALVPPRPAGRWWWWLLAVPTLSPVTLATVALPGEVNGWLAGLADPMVHGALGVLGTAVVLLTRRRNDRGPAELAVAVLATALVVTLATQWRYDAPSGYHPVIVAATLVAAATALVTGVLGRRAVTALPVVAAADADHA